MRLLDISQHHVTLVQAILAEAALHQLQIPQLIRVRGIRLGQDSLVEHLLVDLEELLLGAVDIDEGGDDIVLPSLG